MPKYLVETISMFRIRYVVECENAEHAKDTVTKPELTDGLPVLPAEVDDGPWEESVASAKLTLEYSIDKLHDRGKFFIGAGEEVYPGMVIGEHIRPDDLVVNLCGEKKLTNIM